MFAILVLIRSKFAAFENTVKAFYKYVFTAPKETYSRST